MRATLLQLLCLVSVVTADLARAQFPARPEGDGPVVVDDASLLDAETRGEIERILGKLLADGQPPLVVVTVESLEGQTVEGYAGRLFDAWGIGQKERNRGVLLLVATGNRKARIELGANWGGGEHTTSRGIMDDHIIPAFKRGDFGTGVLDGVRALDAMIRAEPIPTPRRPWWFWPTALLFIAVVIGIAVSLFRSGRTGWGWIFLIGVGMLLFFIIRASSRGGSGGSFGGGFSGGGGATGSW